MFDVEDAFDDALRAYFKKVKEYVDKNRDVKDAADNIPDAFKMVSEARKRFAARIELDATCENERKNGISDLFFAEGDARTKARFIEMKARSALNDGTIDKFVCASFQDLLNYSYLDSRREARRNFAIAQN